MKVVKDRQIYAYLCVGFYNQLFQLSVHAVLCTAFALPGFTRLEKQHENIEKQTVSMAFEAQEEQDVQNVQDIFWKIERFNQVTLVT